MNEGYIAVLDKISSISPTPGGGAVAALALGHSYSLVSMVSLLTLKSDKWVKGHKIGKNLKNISEKGILHSIDLANNDCIAFDNVMNSYIFRMRIEPKPTRCPSRSYNQAGFT